MVTPIFLLGYRPLTLRRPPPTRRAGSADRIWSITALVPSATPIFVYHANKLTSASIVTSSLRLIASCLHCVCISNAGLIEQLAESPAILDRFLNIRRQFVRIVDGDPFAATAPIQHVTGMALAPGAGRTVLPNTGALS